VPALLLVSPVQWLLPTAPAASQDIIYQVTSAIYVPITALFATHLLALLATQDII